MHQTQIRERQVAGDALQWKQGQLSRTLSYSNITIFIFAFGMVHLKTGLYVIAKEEVTFIMKRCSRMASDQKCNMIDYIHKHVCIRQ